VSLFVPTWHTEKRGEIALPSNPDNPEKPFPPLSGEESQDIYPRFSCWDRRRVVLTFDPDRLRRHEAQAARTAAALAERFCEACGFSFWRVTSRGDADCYACSLVREGKPLRCTGCGREEWRRDEHGHARCATCHEEDARVAAPSAIVRPESTSRDVSEEGGAA
jgi:hypothetical protein